MQYDNLCTNTLEASRASLREKACATSPLWFGVLILGWIIGEFPNRQEQSFGKGRHGLWAVFSWLLFP